MNRRIPIKSINDVVTSDDVTCSKKAQYMSNYPEYVSCKNKECKKYSNGKCEMRLRWGDNEPQQVQYGDGKSETSQVSTFSKDDMCSYIHTAVMSGIDPSSISYYRYGSDKIQFKTPAAGGSDELKFLAFVDMEKAPLDASVEHFLQVPRSASV
ncbi:hypothetical protein Q3G72_019135 [Acer saccharum]|nr:hypothetical protein Q3G72_019135 [Acer saccharum]